MFRKSSVSCFRARNLIFQNNCVQITSCNPRKFFSTSNTENSEPESNGPLHGIRVLDLTRILAGPFCSLLLGDLGAEIIKVERPGHGDDTRTWGPPFVNGISCYFVCVNRNKKSIVVDMKKGSHILKELAGNCDILIENYVPGSLDKFGLSYKDISKVNPKLIYCSITGFGATGPYNQRGGYDIIASSLGGLMHITGPRDGDPCKVGVAMTDLSTGLYAHGAIMAALLHRYSTKKGQWINCNLLSTQVSLLANLGSNYLNSGVEAQRWGTEHESIVPYESFKTKDNRWITIGAGNNGLFCELCDILQRPDLKTSPEYANNELRVKNREPLLKILRNILESKTVEEWNEIFKGSRFPYGAVNDMQSTFNDPQVIHNDMIREMGPFKLIGPAVKFSSSMNQPRSPPPTLGQHTREVLRNLTKLSEEEVNALYEQKVIQ